MTNPYPKPIAGSYRNILVKGLREIGQNKLANAFENRQINFAIVSSMTGSVKTMPEIIDACLVAFQSLNQNDIAGYYIHELKVGNVIPASSEGVFVYDADDKEAVEKVKQIIEQEGNKKFGAGELYFKS